ncbi:MAG TPA: hypothetical protein DCX06_12735, partial [Opitutae bacterium]|nr:hypothetical protein [Opitutae bacterium]
LSALVICAASPFIQAAEGDFLRSVQLSGAGTPVGIVSIGSGQFAVTDISPSSFSIYNSDGSISGASIPLTGNPIGITLFGNQFAVTNTSSDTVQIYNSAGVEQSSFAVSSTFPEGIAYVSANDSFYVVDGSGNNEVLEYQSNGSFTQAFSINGSSPDGIVYASARDTFFIYDSGTDSIREYDRTFNELSSFPGSANAGFSGGEGLALQNGELVLVATGSDALVFFSLIDQEALDAFFGGSVPYALAQRRAQQYLYQFSNRSVDSRLLYLHHEMAVAEQEPSETTKESRPSGFNSDGFRYYVDGGVSSIDAELRDDLSGFDGESYSGSVGVEYLVNKDFVAGMSAHYVYSELDFDENAATTESKGYAFSPYFTHSFESPLLDTTRIEKIIVDGYISYARYENELERDSGLGDQARAETDSEFYGASLSFRTPFQHKDMKFIPYISVDWSHGKIDEYSERGSDRTNTSVEAQDFESLLLELGISGSKSFATKYGQLTPHLLLGLRKELLEDQQDVLISGVNDLGASLGPQFTIDAETSNYDATAVIIGSGLNLNISEHLTASINYQAAIMDGGYSSHSLLFRVGCSF